MKLILFTKIFQNCSVEELGQSAKGLGVDGLDLAVRRAQPVEPAHVATQLPAAVKYFEGLGLTVPMVTLEGSHTDPATDEIKSIYRACAESGIPFTKLGYWSFKPGDSYWDGLASIRTALGEFEKLSREYKVCSLLHTHAGSLYGNNVASTMMLANGFDPEHIGVYLDPGHQAFEGERGAVALAMAGKYLKMIGVKDARHTLLEENGKRTWTQDWVPLGEGMVDWPAYLRLLKERGYSGPLSVHATYSAHRDKEGALRLAEQDLATLRGYLAEVYPE